MTKVSQGATIFLFFCVITLFSVFYSFPVRVNALGTAADAMCNPVIPSCPCNTVPGPKGCQPGVNHFMCPGYCKDFTSGFNAATGVCVAPNKCLANSTGGNPITDISKLLEGVSKLMDLLKGAGGGGGGSGSGAPAGCSQYYQVSTPSSDPCAYYVPLASDSLNGSSTTNGSGSAASDLLNALGGTPATPASDLITTPTNTGSSSATNNSNTANTTPAANTPASQSAVLFVRQQSVLTPTGQGLNGDIRIMQNGATLIVSNPNTQSNSVTAGFMGADSSGTMQPQGIVQGWCQNRPWASNFLSMIIPPTFFDGLCTIRGYRVGAPAVVVTPAVTLTQTKTVAKPVSKPVATTTVATSTPVLGPAPEVQIWAVPASVPLGTRTTVFWTSKNAATCTETSPDGSFSHSTLSGGGATVPLSGATTFSISCVSADGRRATDFVTVGLSL